MTHNQATSNVLAVRRMLGGVDLSDALPDRRITAEHFARVAMTTVQTSRGLDECDPRSVVACIVESAQLGLLPESSLGEAYLVPFGKRATLIIGYRGLLKLIRQSGEITAIQAHPVYEGDRFKYYLGLEPNIVHTPDFENPRRESLPVTHVYAFAEFKTGEKQFVVMSKAEVDSIRGRSRAGKSGPWKTDYVAMALKTVVRRLAKMLPMSHAASRAVDLDEQADRDEQVLRGTAEILKDPEPEPDFTDEDFTEADFAPDDPV